MLWLEFAEVLATITKSLGSCNRETNNKPTDGPVTFSITWYQCPPRPERNANAIAKLNSCLRAPFVVASTATKPATWYLSARALYWSAALGTPEPEAPVYLLAVTAGSFTGELHTNIYGVMHTSQVLRPGFGSTTSLLQIDGVTSYETIRTLQKQSFSTPIK